MKTTNIALVFMVVYLSVFLQWKSQVQLQISKRCEQHQLVKVTLFTFNFHIEGFFGLEAAYIFFSLSRGVNFLSRRVSNTFYMA